MVKVSGDKNLGERGNLAVNGQMPSVASISQRQGSERRVIYYSILKNKSKLPLCSIVRWGQERGKDNIPERPPFFKAEETLASFPLLTFGLWMLKNQFCVSVVRGYSRDEFPSASPFCHFGNQWLSPRSRSRSYSHTQDEHPSGELLKTPADPKRVTPGEGSRATPQNIQKNRWTLEKTGKLCLEHRQVLSAQVYAQRGCVE